MYQLILLSVLLLRCFASPIERIVNGTNAKLGEIPYIVSLRSFGGHGCGGSILDATHILTACHCVYRSGPEYLTIQYGVTKIGGPENVIQVTKVVEHPEFYYGGSYQNDIAVLTLASPIKFSENVKPTTLPKSHDSTPGDSNAILAGWGLSSSSGTIMKDLQRVDIKIYTDEECEARHPGRTRREWHVCAGIPEGGKGQCSGDSGGPLFVNGEQRGVVSWSIKPCTIKGYPGVFANVASYVDWIREQMK